MLKVSCFAVPGGAVLLAATSNPDRIEAPVTARAYFLCVFASFGGIFFGYDTGWMSGVLGLSSFHSFVRRCLTLSIA